VAKRWAHGMTTSPSTDPMPAVCDFTAPRKSSRMLTVGSEVPGSGPQGHGYSLPRK